MARSESVRRIRVRELEKIYTVGEVEVPALRGVNLDIEDGEFVAVVGPSGSGKSTFMHILGCLDHPTRGTYHLGEKDVSRISPDERARIRNQQIGFVFQSFNLLPRTAAVDNVEVPLLYGDRPLARTERRERAMEALTALGLTERALHHPNQLSGGQQQRVAIARALVNHPGIVLADEPTGNLDSRTSIEMMDVFQRLNEERGITLVVITHERVIAEYATRIVSFRDGVVVSDEATAVRRSAREEMERGSETLAGV